MLFRSREELRKEYNKKVKEGKILPPSRNDNLIAAGVNSNNASAETKKELSKLIDFANKFHRVEECGRI